MTPNRHSGTVEERLRQTEQLVRAAQPADADALDALVRTHLPDLRAFVRTHLGVALRRIESESDIVQSVCRELVEDLPGFEYRGPGSFRAWLFTATLNKIRQKDAYWTAQMRDHRRSVSLDAPDGRDTTDPSIYASLCHVDPRPSELASAAELRERIEAAIDALSPEHREVLGLARIVGLSRREIGERLGKSEVAVRALLGRASVQLLAALEGRG